MVKTNLKKPSKSDRLKDTLDYSLLYKVIEQEMKIKSFLIETVCERILDNLFNSFPSIIKASLKISKLNLIGINDKPVVISCDNLLKNCGNVGRGTDP